jgi:hypothetical protein
MSSNGRQKNDSCLLSAILLPHVKEYLLLVLPSTVFGSAVQKIMMPNGSGFICGGLGRRRFRRAISIRRRAVAAPEVRMFGLLMRRWGGLEKVGSGGVNTLHTRHDAAGRCDGRRRRCQKPAAVDGQREIWSGHDALLRNEGLALFATFAVVVGHIPVYGRPPCCGKPVGESARASVLMQAEEYSLLSRQQQSVF